MYSVVLSFAPSCSSPPFFEKDTGFPRQLGLQSPGQLQISSEVRGWYRWVGGDMEQSDDGQRRGRRDRREKEGGWEKFEKGREKEPASLRDRSASE